MTDAQAMIMELEGTGRQVNGQFMPYQDLVGKLTIGYGHNLDDNGIPSEVANLLLQADLANAIEAVRANCSCYDQLSRPRQLVLISMGFQFGKEGLSKWPRFLGAVHLGNFDEAAEELLDSKAAKVQAPVRFHILATMLRENVSQWV